MRTNKKVLLFKGWGTTKQFKSQHPDYLRKANVRVVDINTCSYKFRRKFITKNSSRICTWSSDKDSCMVSFFFNYNFILF